MSQQSSYEAKAARLEEIIRRLEKGDVTLEEGLSCFEEGISLLKNCQQELERAEKRIQVLTQEGVLVPFPGEQQEENGE